MSEITYVYTTYENNYETIFKEGICFFDSSYDINKILTRIYTEDELFDFLKKLDSSEKAFIIRIPASYMEVQRSNSNYKVLPYPMLHEKECMNPSSTEYNSYPVLVPSLIQMMYCGSVGCVPNPYYNQKYNPNGLKYTKTQLDSILKKMPGEYERFKTRNKGDCRELFDLDKASNIWNYVIAFNNLDGVMTEPFAFQGELPDVRFTVKKKKKVKNLQKKKKRVKYYGDEEEY
jgi:hypothetical protein